MKPSKFFVNFLRFRFVFLVFFFSIFFPDTVVFAFPEMVRYGHPHCTACHISPNGGGILNRYGRASSQELLSTWGRTYAERLSKDKDTFKEERQKTTISLESKDSAFLWGAFELPSRLDLMGMVRTLNTYQKNNNSQSFRYTLMQTDLEAAYALDRRKKLIVVGTIGYTDLSPNDPFVSNSILSRRHYLLYRPTNDWNIRIGRFFSAYGINSANHYLTTRRSLEWDEGKETYNLETSWLGPSSGIQVTANFGRPDRPNLNRELGFVARGYKAIGHRSQVGLNYYWGKSEITHTQLLGPWMILGFSKRVFLLSELDLRIFQALQLEEERMGLAGFNRFNVELTQGLHIYFLQDFLQRNFSSTNAIVHSYGLGFQFFPKSHYQVDLLASQRFTSTDQAQILAWLMLNVYL